MDEGRLGCKERRGFFFVILARPSRAFDSATSLNRVIAPLTE